MRQGQQNRRGRSRNRKGQNPLTRSYESNGPDVKIRGTPAHVAEKYMSLARDAMAAGDRVLAENYYQHAEHYNRIIMAYRDQQLGQSQDGASAGGRQRSANDDFSDDASDDDIDTTSADIGAQPQPTPRGYEDQPATEAAAQSEQQRPSARGRASGQRRGRPRNNPAQKNGNGNANGHGSSEGRNGSGSEEARRFADSDDQPEFLRRPVRRSRRSAQNADADGAATSTDAAAAPQASVDE